MYVCVGVCVCVRDRCFRMLHFIILLTFYIRILGQRNIYVHTETKRQRNEHFASFDRRLYWQWLLHTLTHMNMSYLSIILFCISVAVFRFVFIRSIALLLF